MRLSSPPVFMADVVISSRLDGGLGRPRSAMVREGR